MTPVLIAAFRLLAAVGGMVAAISHFVAGEYGLVWAPLAVAFLAWKG